MERFKGGVWFWALLIAAMVPAVAHGQTLKKSQKCLYTANIVPNGGSGQIVMTTKVYQLGDGSMTASVDVTYAVLSFMPGIEKIGLTNGTWNLSLCDNSGADTCDYDVNGKLLVSGALSSPLPQGFPSALQNGQIFVKLFDANNDVLASGNFTLAQPCQVRVY